MKKSYLLLLAVAVAAVWSQNPCPSLDTAVSASCAPQCSCFTANAVPPACAAAGGVCNQPCEVVNALHSGDFDMEEVGTNCLWITTSGVVDGRVLGTSDA